jgi:hypothetical protein
MRYLASLSPVTFPLYEGCRITKISVYQVDLPLHEKAYKWSGGNAVSVFDATVRSLASAENFK